jgi:Phage integrase, N-terminal SAM-like domain
MRAAPAAVRHARSSSATRQRLVARARRRWHSDRVVSDSLGREISAYGDHLRVERGLSVNTLAAYGRDLDRYASWLRAHGIHTPQAVTGDTLESYATF